ncbi:MAG: hypothetical protein HRT44_05560 [Bdellovibrionales bacterium]|nr:hypothetical protein [Bdellovibrionales bacterium]NQZ18710.1 hypothetical protein [Bdellovibrionales bacterium]
MAKTILTLMIITFSLPSYSQTGTETCVDKKMFLRDICKSQELKNSKAIFSNCANGFEYEVSMDGKNIDSSFVTTDIQCKIVEVRQQDGIETRTEYFDEINKKVVVYQHDNGISNAYVYGHTGYYHITKFASGDSIFNFHTFEN